MNQVRAAIDRLDLEIVFLLGKRFRFIEAAARIKQAGSEIRDDARKTQVLENVRAAASIANIPGGLATALFELLIEESIRYEMERFGHLDTPAGAPAAGRSRRSGPDGSENR